MSGADTKYLWLTGCQQPDHVTLWRFYKPRQGMRKLFERTVRTAAGAGGTGGTGGDGTKVGANAARERT